MLNRDEYLKAFGARVRLARESHGLTLQEVADRAGYTSKGSRSTISSIEKGKNDIPLSKVSVLAEALGVDPHWLLFGEEDDL